MNIDARIAYIMAPHSPDDKRPHHQIRLLIRDVLDTFEKQLIETAVGETSSRFDDQIRYTITNEAMYDARKELGL